MSWTTLKYKQVTIRKPRSCECCGTRFSPGEKMQYIVAVDEGDFVGWYACLCCNAYMEQHRDHAMADDGEIYGDFHHEAHYKEFRQQFSTTSE